MSKVQDVMTASRANPNAVNAGKSAIAAVCNEVKRLIASNDITGAQAVLAEVLANARAMVSATIENSTVAHLVDASTGSPKV